MRIKRIPDYKDYVDITNTILMKRNGFVKAEFFHLPQGRIGVLFFHKNIFWYWLR